MAGNLLSSPDALFRHIGLLFGERFENIRIHPYTRYRIRIGFIFFFHSGERIYFFPDLLSNSRDACGR